MNPLLIDIDLGMPAILWLALGLVGASRPGQPAHSHAFCPVIPFFLTTWFAPRFLLIETHLSHRAQDSVLYPFSSVLQLLPISSSLNVYCLFSCLEQWLQGSKQKS